MTEILKGTEHLYVAAGKNTELNKEVKAQWLKALRSGEYPQDYLRLRTPNGFCCLGVLADLYGKAHGIQWEEKVELKKVVYQFESAGGYPSADVCKWVNGLSWDSTIEGLKDRADDRVSLTDLNDSGQFNFSQIADVIEHFL